jgi:hypothetical protein
LVTVEKLAAVSPGPRSFTDSGALLAGHTPQHQPSFTKTKRADITLQMASHPGLYVSKVYARALEPSPVDSTPKLGFGFSTLNSVGVTRVQNDLCVRELPWSPAVQGKEIDSPGPAAYAMPAGIEQASVGGHVSGYRNSRCHFEQTVHEHGESGKPGPGTHSLPGTLARQGGLMCREDPGEFKFDYDARRLEFKGAPGQHQPDEGGTTLSRSGARMATADGPRTRMYLDPESPWLREKAGQPSPADVNTCTSLAQPSFNAAVHQEEQLRRKRLSKKQLRRSNKAAANAARAVSKMRMLTARATHPDAGRAAVGAAGGAAAEWAEGAAAAGLAASASADAMMFPRIASPVASRRGLGGTVTFDSPIAAPAPQQQKHVHYSL